MQCIMFLTAAHKTHIHQTAHAPPPPLASAVDEPDGPDCAEGSKTVVLSLGLVGNIADETPSGGATAKTAAESDAVPISCSGKCSHNAMSHNAISNNTISHDADTMSDHISSMNITSPIILSGYSGKRPN